MIDNNRKITVSHRYEQADIETGVLKQSFVVSVEGETVQVTGSQRRFSQNKLPNMSGLLEGNVGPRMVSGKQVMKQSYDPSQDLLT